MASRLLRVLDAFDLDSPELRLAQIGRRTGLPAATLHRLLSELVSHGAIERTGAGRYTVGLRLWEIGRLAPRASLLDRAAQPHLEDLYEATHGSLHLAVLHGTYALYVTNISGHHPVDPGVRVGTRIPLTSLGAGEVLLAYADPDLIERVLVDYPRTNGHPIASTHPIRQRLAGIRRSGVAVTRRGLRSVVVAAPVFGPSGGVVAALSAAVRATDPQHVPVGLVRLAANRIAQELVGAIGGGAPGYETDTNRSSAQ